jgi:hypothetical protein
MNGTENGAAFGARGTFAMVAAGFVAFVVLLAWLGTGEPGGNNGGAHAQGKGIAGYAALATMLADDGQQIGYNRVPGRVGGHELLVLTPLANVDTKELARVVQLRRSGMGPTIVVTPKWYTLPLTSDPRAPPGTWTRLMGPPRAPAGWTTIVGAGLPHWPGFLDHLGVALGNRKSAPAHGWHSGDGAAGPLPDDQVVLSGGGADDAGAPLVPLVRSGDGRILAGYFADGGSYPALEAMAGITPAADAPDETKSGRQPLVVVFEPDLLNNRGLADAATARNARRLVLAAAGRGVPRVVFDLSLAGLGAPRNLLTLAFSPPFLAATICLILAMAGVMWRGFARFGPAQLGDPGVPAGKVALVGGGATLLLRARRYHLIAGPYADAARERLGLALGLPRRRPAPETDAAIERIQLGLAPGTIPFGEAAAKLAGATGPETIALHAAELHAIEQALSRKGGS